MYDPGEFVTVGGGEYVIETGGTLQQDGLSNAFLVFCFLVTRGGGQEKVH